MYNDNIKVEKYINRYKNYFYFPLALTLTGFLVMIALKVLLNTDVFKVAGIVPMIIIASGICWMINTMKICIDEERKIRDRIVEDTIEWLRINYPDFKCCKINDDFDINYPDCKVRTIIQIEGNIKYDFKFRYSEIYTETYRENSVGTYELYQFRGYIIEWTGEDGDVHLRYIQHPQGISDFDIENILELIKDSINKVEIEGRVIY